MKLVDILARELKVWPGSRITAITQSCVDSELYGENPLGEVIWRKSLASEECSPNGMGDDRQRVTRTQWQAAVDAMKAESAPAWAGIGLPPVGTVCEYRVDGDDWRECVVIAHHADLAVCWIHCNKIFSTNGTAVRPIHTPEQIAADERNLSIGEMREIWNFAASSGADPLIALYAAGYRKFEIVDN